MTIFFWNIRKNPQTFSTLGTIVVEESVDVIALAEFPPDSVDSLLAELNKTQELFAHCVQLSKHKVEVFYRKDKARVCDMGNLGRYSAVQLENVNGGLKVYAFFVHLQSKLNGNTEDNKRQEASRLSNEIADFENTVSKVNHTFVCGDFNMNPFELGMITCDALNSVMDREVVIKKNGIRKKDNESYKFFYNPMWSCLGDSSIGQSSGTYFDMSNKTDTIYWNMIDQVIIRKELIDVFDISKLKIVTKGNNYDLLDRYACINRKISDHLPILFNLNI